MTLKKPVERSGRYPSLATEALPESIQRRLREPNPDWDWFVSGGYIVCRLYDGEYEQRVAAKIVETVDA